MENNIFKKGVAVCIIALLISISIIPLAGSISVKNYVAWTSSEGVDLLCDDPYQNVKQGATATFVVKITNIGTLDDTYDVIAGSIEDIICKVNGVNADKYNPYEITLITGESTTFEVTAEVWESVPLGEWSVIVEARSQNNTDVYDELILTANVQKKSKLISIFEEDCGCQDVNRVDLLRFRLLLIRIEAINNVILTRFGHIPEIREKCEEILDVIYSDDSGLFCDILGIFFNIYIALILTYNPILELIAFITLFPYVTLWFLLCDELPL